ncbi:MAG: hypothetical protein LBQ48_07520 [Oscillospiraceae bacterium]|nr:hypothetical protein [Oscillospiraceae bacterium]
MACTFCVLFIAVSLFSEIYIITHANHEHDHIGANGACATCAQITATANLLNQLSIAIVKAAAIVFNLFAVLSLLCFFIGFIYGSSPVTLKVKLNN